MQPRAAICSRRQWLVWASASCAACAPPRQETAARLGQPLPTTDSANAATQAATGGAATSTAAPATPQLTIALQALGEQFPSERVELVKAALQASYLCDVVVLPRTDLPAAAYTQARKRYRAERLLDTLLSVKPDSAQRVLGLTAVDISTTKGNVADWGILGLATIDGRACVISSFRTSRGAKDAEHAAQRFAKTAVHEIGHTLGLEHCPNAGCLMEDGKGTVFTTDHEYALCKDCRALLTSKGVALAPENTMQPWPPVQ